MVATAVLLLAYVIAPSLSLVGAVVIENGASTIVFELGTVNAERVISARAAIFAATPYPELLKIDVPIPIHVIPSVEYAMVFVPYPAPTHWFNSALYATVNPQIVKIEVPNPVHVMPSVEYAMVFVPEPTATHRFCSTLYATPIP